MPLGARIMQLRSPGEYKIMHITDVQSKPPRVQAGLPLQAAVAMSGCALSTADCKLTCICKEAACQELS